MKPWWLDKDSEIEVRRKGHGDMEERAWITLGELLDWKEAKEALPSRQEEILESLDGAVLGRRTPTPYDE